LWFSALPADLDLAKALCTTCVIRQMCLDGARKRGEPHGVWGGEIFDNGVVIARKRPRGRPRKRDRGCVRL
jgi:WhiB family redox-sensing transcriptional regulator